MTDMPPMRRKRVRLHIKPLTGVIGRKVQLRDQISKALTSYNSPGIVRKVEQAWNRLQIEDPYRDGQWHQESEYVWQLLQEAEARRKTGDPAFDSKTTEILKDSQLLDGVHQSYEEWNNGPMRFTTAEPLKHTRPPRLSPYERLLPTPCDNNGKLSSTYTALVPRPKELTRSPFVGVSALKDENDMKSFFGPSEALPYFKFYTIFYDHANEWGKQDVHSTHWTTIFPSWRTPDNPDGINIAQFENFTYEMFVEKGWDEMRPLKLLVNRKDTSTDVLGLAVQRGIRRAAIQRVLNLITNSENRDINTPWRRVAFPEPIKKFHYNHFHPWALGRREHISRGMNDRNLMAISDRHLEGEPSPWIYWFNEWRQQANYLSAWTRQSYNKRYWDDFKKIALPVNYRGPYSITNQCIYDDYWLKMGQKLVTLQANLEKLAVTHKRWLLERVVEDIKRGEDGHLITNDIIPRPDIDFVLDQPTKFQLVDETDVAWLKFLCQPPSTKALSGLTLSKPADTLIIILDHRLQTLFNDMLHNPFWMTDTVPGDPKPRFRLREMLLEDILPMINRGARTFKRRVWKQHNNAVTEYQTAPKLEPTGAPIPNSLYQFSLKEVKLYCTRLAKMGRITYKRPEDPHEFTGMRWSGTGTLYYYPDLHFKSAGGSIVPIPLEVEPNIRHMLSSSIDYDENAVRYPEERIRWRYQNKITFQNENEFQKKLFKDEMVRRDRNATNTHHESKEAYEEEFLPEIIWKQDVTFHEQSIENLRQSPAWEDILDDETVLATDVGCSFKTINFIRNLAYRMGRTIRHYRALKTRANTASSFTRGHLHIALDQWKLHIENTWANDENPEDATAIPLKLGKPNGVIEKASKTNPNKDSQSMTTVFKEIRNGIINDMVNNRTMNYPGRRTLFTDKHKFMGHYFERANIWSWGTEQIRARHAAYRRQRYFDVKRWPVNRQSKETQTNITTRLDEDPSIQPVSALYKYNIKVGPIKMVPEHSDVVSRLISLLKDPDKEIVARQLVQYLSKEIVKIVKKTENLGTGWEIRVAPPGTKTTIMSNNSSGDSTAAGIGTKAKPMIRPKQTFIPGPAVFHMGDTLLQQVKLSQDLERILDPQNPGIFTSIWNEFTDWLTPPPERIPLLPDINLAKAPSTGRLNLKRKVNTAFIVSDRGAHKKKTIHKLHNSPSTNLRQRPLKDHTGGEEAGPGGRTPLPGTASVFTDGMNIDNVLPLRQCVSGFEIITSSKDQDGTFKIKIRPDMEDVMKMNIAGADTHGVTRPFGDRPIAYPRLKRIPTAGPKPNSKLSGVLVAGKSGLDYEIDSIQIDDNNDLDLHAKPGHRHQNQQEKRINGKMESLKNHKNEVQELADKHQLVAHHPHIYPFETRGRLKQQFDNTSAKA